MVGLRAIPVLGGLCARLREFARGAETIIIGPQVFDLLLHLVKNREHVVTKDNLIDVVWGRPDRLGIHPDQPHKCGTQGSR